MKKVGVLLDKLYFDHDNGMGHPESQHRLLAILDMLKETKLFDEVYRLQPRDATMEEICLVHDPNYYDVIKSTRGKPRVFLDADTTTCPISFDAAVRAVGGVLSAIDGVVNNEVNTAFPLVRPPGHHAERDRAMGFCLFNNVAIGAAYIIKSFDFKRVLIIDWDLHHGNGTQNMFYDSSEILYFSTHQYPYYPGTGSASEVGVGSGEGYNINVPLNAGMGDNEYVKIFFEILGPVIDQFNPEFILVSAGFDTYSGDPLGGMNVTPKGFAQLTRYLKEKAEKYCNGRIIYILEGGYDLDGLSLSVKEVVEEILEKKKTDYADIHDNTEADHIIKGIIKIQEQFWKF